VRRATQRPPWRWNSRILCAHCHRLRGEGQGKCSRVPCPSASGVRRQPRLAPTDAGQPDESPARRDPRVFPLVTRGKARGALVAGARPLRARSPRHLSLADSLAGRAASALDELPALRVDPARRPAQERVSSPRLPIFAIRSRPACGVAMLRARPWTPRRPLVASNHGRQVGHMTRLVADLLDILRASSSRSIDLPPRTIGGRRGSAQSQSIRASQLESAATEVVINVPP